MPTYEYACKSCGDRLEVVQAFTDDPLTECRACEGPLRKVFGNVGITFKGSGFYKTDSRKASSTSSSSSDSGGKSDSSSGSSGETSGSSDSTSSKGSTSSTSDSSGGKSDSSGSSSGTGKPTAAAS